MLCLLKRKEILKLFAWFLECREIEESQYRNKRSITFETVKETKFIIVVLYKVGA